MPKKSGVRCEYMFDERRQCTKDATYHMTEGKGSFLCTEHMKKMKPFKLRMRKL